VKASLLLSRIAEREAIAATRDEVDKEVERLARQQREPVAALQMKFEKDGTMGRIASHIQTEKTLSFLFEHARKTANIGPAGPYSTLLTHRVHCLRGAVQVIIEMKSNEVPYRLPLAEEENLREACRIR